MLVGSFFPVGKITYDLETEVEGSPEEGFVIDWHKSAGTKFIKYLRGRLKLTPVGDGGSTQVTYLAEVSAARLSLDKVERRAVDYLERLRTILEERHEGHPSLWAQIEEGSQ